MSYWNYWAMNRPPFSQSAKAIFDCVANEEARARIDFLINNQRAAGSIIGPSGVGKTTLLRQCQKAAIDASFTSRDFYLNCAHVSLLGKREGELISALANQLDPKILNTVPAWTRLLDQFSAMKREGAHLALLLDDLHLASLDAQTDIIRLLSMSLPITVLFTAEPEFLGNMLVQLKERVDLQVDLTGWEISQTGQYLAWAMQQAGRNSPIFSDDAVERLQALSGGIIRKIILLADLALVAGAVERMPYIDGDCIEQVAFELPAAKAA